MMITRRQRQRRAAILQLAIVATLAAVIFTPRLDIAPDTGNDIALADIGQSSSTFVKP